MNYFFNPNPKQVWLVSLLYILIGLLLCFFNISVFTLATQILGIAFISIGGFMLYMYFYKRYTIETYSLFIGLPVLLIGILMVLSPESIFAILPILAGILIIINSVIQMQKALVLKDFGYPNWLFAFLFAVFTLVAGIFILSKPVQTLSFILQLIGICFIVEGILIFLSNHTLRKYYN